MYKLTALAQLHQTNHFIAIKMSYNINIFFNQIEIFIF